MVIWRNRYSTTTGIIIPKAGFHVSHPGRHFIHRRKGFEGDHIFICFHTPVLLFHPKEERMITLPKESCIFYRARTFQYYGSKGEGFNHSWFHVSGTKVNSLIDQYDIPFDTPCTLSATYRIVQPIQRMVQEMHHRPAHWETSLSLVFKEWLIHFSRELQVSYDSQESSETHTRFLRIRDMIMHAPHRWNIDALARHACLSRSRFSVLYRTFFGTSPLQDILDMRLQRASWLLTHTGRSIKSIGEEIGYDDPAYFCRIFKKKQGVAPSAYR